jgi:hypothetical protein
MAMARDKGRSRDHRGTKKIYQKGPNPLARPEHYHGDQARPHPHEGTSGAREYLADRLDGARDLYLLALALGVRGDGARLFGPMIREARIHFTSVIEECRIAGLDTSAIAVMLGKQNEELVDSIRPEIWGHLEQLIAQRRGGHARSGYDQGTTPAF